MALVAKALASIMVLLNPLLEASRLLIRVKRTSKKKKTQTFEKSLNLCLQRRHYREHKASAEMCHTPSVQILVADKTHRAGTLVTQQNAKFTFSLVWKHERNGISSTFHLCGEQEKLISLQVEIPRIGLTSPGLPTTIHLSGLKMGDAMRNRGATAGTWPLSYDILTLFNFSPHKSCLLKQTLRSLARHLDIRLQPRVFLITECSWNWFPQSRVPGSCLGPTGSRLR